MTQQLTAAEIAAKMTPGPWVQDYDGSKGHIKSISEKCRLMPSGSRSTPTVARYDIVVHEEEVFKANAAAIVLAVNETFGKGYNPEAMDVLYKALEQAKRDLIFVRTIKGTAQGLSLEKAQYHAENGLDVQAIDAALSTAKIQQES